MDLTLLLLLTTLCHIPLFAFSLDFKDLELNEKINRLVRNQRSYEPETSPCSNRCERLIERSLKRIGYSPKNLENSFKRNLVVDKMDAVCWKMADYDDCINRCPFSEEKNTLLEDLRGIAKKNCKLHNREYVEEVLAPLDCIHKYHSFLEVRCSTYSKEASARRSASLSDHGTTPRRRTVKEELRETCRYLHFHVLCLSNTVFYYCPNAKALYNRFTLRDYFLSFVVPQSDRDFSDELLDYCEVFDFHKIAKEIYGKTIPTSTAQMSTVAVSAITNPDTTLPEVHFSSPKVFAQSAKADDEDSKLKRVFSSEEDLQDTPPNFFYSSARMTPSLRMHYKTTTAKQNIHHYENERTREKTMSDIDDSVEFVTGPVTHPVSISFSLEEDDEDGLGDEVSDEATSSESEVETSTVSAPTLGDEVQLYDDNQLEYDEHTTKDVEPISTISRAGSFYETTKPLNMPEEIATTSTPVEPWTRTGSYAVYHTTDRISTEDTSTEKPLVVTLDNPLLSGSRVHVKKIKHYGEAEEDDDEEDLAEISSMDDEQFEREEDEKDLPTSSPAAIWPMVKIVEVAGSGRRDSPTPTVFILLGIYTVFFIVTIVILTILVLFLMVRSRRKMQVVKVPLYYSERL